MIDPSNITNYNLSSSELEENILFWILAAGKNAMTSSRCLDALLKEWVRKDHKGPFDTISYICCVSDLALEMKKHGIGCYNNKSKSFIDLLSRNIDLKNCSLEELESIRGIGPKTARCFLIHTRKNQKYAGLDTHVLKYMRDLGVKTPKSTPVGKTYKRLEKIFLEIVDISKMNSADLDLMVWRVYSGKENNNLEKNKSFLLSLGKK